MLLLCILTLIRDAVERHAQGGPPTFDHIAQVLASLLKRRRALLSQTLQHDGVALLQTEPKWLREGGSVQDMIDSIISDQWRTVATAVLDPEAHNVEQEEAKFAAGVAMKWRKDIRELVWPYHS